MTEFTGYFRKLAVGIYQIAPAGWERVAKLQAPNSESNIAFVAMRFNDKMKEIFSKTIRPVIIDCCFEPLIIFERNHINKIDDEIIAGIRKSRYIVADFTEQNQGAYYEAGFARGLGLQVISTCDKAEVDSGKIHFDTRQYRTILWERDKLDLFKKELQDCIEANIGIGKNKSKR
jgi:nucleoside 2-deoxyribosyltransferase